MSADVGLWERRRLPGYCVMRTRLQEETWGKAQKETTVLGMCCLLALLDARRGQKTSLEFPSQLSCRQPCCCLQKYFYSPK